MTVISRVLALSYRGLDVIVRTGRRHAAWSLALALVLIPLTVVQPSALAAPAPAPLRIAYFGDSFVWGQGVHTSNKFTTLFARDLATRAGRPVSTDDYSHSGAPLSRFHAGTAALSSTSCGAGFAIPGEVPSASSSVLECQIPAAAASVIVSIWSF